MITTELQHGVTVWYNLFIIYDCAKCPVKCIYLALHYILALDYRINEFSYVLHVLNNYIFHCIKCVVIFAMFHD